MTEATAAIVPAESAAIETEAKSLLDVIARAAADPAVNVEKLERLLAIQQTILADQRRTEFFAALSALEAELPQITKRGQVTVEGQLRSRFAKLEDVDTVIRPLCRKHGFAFSFDSSPGQHGITFSCMMSHRFGHAETKTITLPSDTSGKKNGVQAVASTSSYARRYLLAMHLHLVTRDEDDDGNGGEDAVTAEQATELRRLLAEVGRSEDKFLKWAGAATFEEIPASRYKPALGFIEEAKRQKAGGK